MSKPFEEIAHEAKLSLREFRLNLASMLLELDQAVDEETVSSLGTGNIGAH